MLQVSPKTKVFIAIEPVDFRSGIDGLFGICQQVLDRDPYSGHLFVFRNKRGNAIKILTYDGQGFWLCLKRLSKGRLTWWPNSNTTDASYRLAANRLPVLLYNGNPQQLKLAPNWR